MRISGGFWVLLSWNKEVDRHVDNSKSRDNLLKTAYFPSGRQATGEMVCQLKRMPAARKEGCCGILYGLGIVCVAQASSHIQLSAAHIELAPQIST